jgi:hypothetical protein
MATLRELIIKVSANSQSFQTEIAPLHAWGKTIIKPCRMVGVRLRKESQKALSELTDGFASAGRAATCSCSICYR